MKRRTTPTLVILSVIATAAIATSIKAEAEETIALLMDGTGNGDPNLFTTPTSSGYEDLTPAEMSAVLGGYFNGDTEVSVTTPEELDVAGVPIFGNDTLNTSVAVGTQDINTAINTAIATNPPGTPIVVYGVSQSAIIVSEEEKSFIAEGSSAPSPSQLSFVAEGDPARPSGGIVTRLPQFFAATDPITGIGDYGALPANSPYNTIDVSEQYDLISDFPEYPLDVVADANALLGWSQHPDYTATSTQVHPDLSAIMAEVPDTPGTYIIPSSTGSTGGQVGKVLAPNPNVPTGAQVVVEPPNSAGGTNTYVPVFDQTLPLLQPLTAIGLPAAIITPLNTVLTPIVNAGYDPNSNPGTDAPAQLLPPPSAIVTDVQNEIAAVQSVVTPAATPAVTRADRPKSTPAATPTPAAKPTTAPLSLLLPDTTQPVKVVSHPTFKPPAMSEPANASSHKRHNG